MLSATRPKVELPVEETNVAVITGPPGRLELSGFPYYVLSVAVSIAISGYSSYLITMQVGGTANTSGASPCDRPEEKGKAPSSNTAACDTRITAAILAVHRHI